MSAPWASTPSTAAETNQSLVRQFTGLAADYYEAKFEMLQRGSLELLHLNSAALLAGPFWGAARGVCRSRPVSGFARQLIGTPAW